MAKNVRTFFPKGLLAQIREKRGWTQEEVAKAIGTSRPNYANIERGALRATPELATRIARFYGIGDPDVVFTKTLIDKLSPEQREQLLALVAGKHCIAQLEREKRTNSRIARIIEQGGVFYSDDLPDEPEEK